MFDCFLLGCLWNSSYFSFGYVTYLYYLYYLLLHEWLLTIVWLQSKVLWISIINIPGDNGSLYAFGANSYGQLGNGNKANVTTPLRIAESLGRIIDIGAVHYGHISACETHSKVYMVCAAWFSCYPIPQIKYHKSVVYVFVLTFFCFVSVQWRQCRGQSQVLPVENPFKTMHDVFACCSTPPVTHVPIESRVSDSELNIVEALKLAFDDPVSNAFYLAIYIKISGLQLSTHEEY